MPRKAPLLPAAFALLVALPSPGEAAGDAEKGRQIAVDHCSRCHVVPDYDPYGGIDSTPSFRLLARRDDYLERFQTFFERPPHPVVVRIPGVEPPTDDPAFVATFQIQPEQVDDIVAYAKKLHAEQ
ncbi:c-type cytochrome [Pelagibius marinus]|uniref:c-type cytochrome n=1 Tax=Pelagibius marinus TaxID=2762760 RepID=UPI001872C96B|nr:c-type cytochrome [Pelagibius marinus]